MQGLSNEKEGRKSMLKKLEALQMQASVRVSEALQPLNAFTAPFYIQVLRGYAEEIEKMFPGAGDVAKKLDETADKKVIIIHVKDDSPEAATPRKSGN